MGHLNGELVVNPLMADIAESRLDLVVAGTRDAVLMVEAGAYELTEDEMLEAVKMGHAVCKQLADLQDELVRLCGKTKRVFVPPAIDTSLEETVSGWLGRKLRDAVRSPVKQEREARTEQLKAETIAHFTADEPEEEIEARTKEVSKAFEKLLKAEVRNAILDDGIRVDGRAVDEIRPISVDVGVVPRMHGTGLFTRGQTQVLSVVTLGSPGDEQRLDDLGLETRKRYIHHYNFPPFSTGEAKRLSAPRRRDIGHGALAERSLLAVLPSESEWPYTMRVVSLFERFLIDGLGLRFIAGPDGCGRAAEGAGGRCGDGPDHRSGRALEGVDRHPGP